MSNDRAKRGAGASSAWVRIATFAAMFAFVVALYYYKAHPGLLEKKLGSLGMALIFIGTGVYFCIKAALGVRNGTIRGDHVSMNFKRSDGGMFWFVVVCDSIGGVFMLYGGFGHFFGLW